MSLPNPVRDYALTIGRNGIDSPEAKALREAHAADPGFAGWVKVLDEAYHALRSRGPACPPRRDVP